MAVEPKLTVEVKQTSASGFANALKHNATLRFVTSGEATPSVQPLDDRFWWFMERNGISAASFAALKGGTVLAHRGYSLSPSGRATPPDSLFRLASVSKAFTCALLTRLVASGRLAWDTKVFPFLGIDTPLPEQAEPHDLMKNVTVLELVNHPAWLPRGIDHLGISKALNLTRPPTRNEIVRFVYGTKRIVHLGHTKPKDPPYSNYGYVVLTAVAEKAAGLDFTVAVQKEVLDPLGLAGVWRGVTAESGRLPGEVAYVSTGDGPSCFAPQSTVREPLPYGGDFILENSEGTGGLVANAMTVARTMATYAAWGVGLRGPNWARSGRFPGTQTFVASRPNGVDYAFLCNAAVDDAPMGGFVADLDAVLGAL